MDARIVTDMHVWYRAGASLWVAGVRMTITFTQLTVAKVKSSACAGVALSTILKYTDTHRRSELR